MGIISRKRQDFFAYVNHQNETDLPVQGWIRERLALMGITQKQVQLVREMAPLLEPYKKEMVDHFIKHLLANDKIKEKLDQSGLDNLRQAMEKYVDLLLKASLDQEYVDQRIAIGKMNTHLKMSADWFMVAHHQLIHTITAFVLTRKYSPEKRVEAVLAVQKLAAFDQQIMMEAYLEEMVQERLHNVSDTLNYITQLNATKQLVNGMNHLLDESHNVTSAAQQVSASIQEVAAHSGQVAEQTEVGVRSVDESRGEIQQTLDHIQQVGGVYDQMAKQVENLQTNIEQTYGVIESIQHIADQTDLLALNASIEAARAGEHGRGFAVVAQEIRKLAEHTKAETMQITNRLEALQEAFMEMTRQMEKTASWVEQSVAGTRQAEHALDKIVATMQEINEAITQIAAMTEEQTASITDIAERNSAIYDLGTRSQELAKHTAQIILELSKQLDQQRLALIESYGKLSMQELIKAAKTDHLMWKWRVYNMLLGLEQIDLERVTSHETCRLGQWYYGPLPDEVKNLPAYQELEEPHREVHRWAKEAVRAYQEGRREEAEHAFQQLQEASDTVISLLYDLEDALYQ